MSLSASSVGVGSTGSLVGKVFLVILRYTKIPNTDVGEHTHVDNDAISNVTGAGHYRRVSFFFK